jgi:hypothetical protein
MKPVIQRRWTPEDRISWGIHGLAVLTSEGWLRLHQKIGGRGGRQRAPHLDRTRRRPGVMRQSGIAKPE